MPLCNYCGQTLWGNYISALGVNWHPEHFLCANCNRPLLESEFRVVEGKPYHQTCYVASQIPHCAYCNQPITESYLEYDGKVYHNTCYREHVGPRCRNTMGATTIANVIASILHRAAFIVTSRFCMNM